MKARDVVIRTVLNGWICSVGCQLLVFTDKEVMLEELSIYLTHPEATEKRFQEDSVNAKQLPVVDCDAAGQPVGGADVGSYTLRRDLEDLRTRVGHELDRLSQARMEEAVASGWPDPRGR